MRALASFLSLGFLTAACTGSGGGEGPSQDGESGRPNILVILTDDQREAGTLKVMPTLRLWLLNGGTRFTETYATTPLCCPFRASMFSGRYSHNHNVKRNPESAKLDSELTVQRYLQEDGYTTAIVGKYLNNWPLEQAPPHFDRWVTYKTGVGTRQAVYRKPSINEQGELYEAAEYLTDLVADRAVGLLDDFEEDDDRPWMMFVTPYAPHFPFDAGPKYDKAEVPELTTIAGERDRSDKPPYVGNDPRVPNHEVRRLSKLQLRTLLAVDDLVGNLQDTLKALGEIANTLVFYASDGGYLWGEHGLKKKKLPYTDSIAIPLLVAWPGHLEPGAKDDRLVGTVDLAPTMLAAAGIDLESVHALDGHSLLDQWSRDFILSEHWPGTVTDITHWASLRGRDFQYIENYEKGGRVAFFEYYDLRNDPGQLVNLLGDRDPGNDPSEKRLSELARDLAEARSCEGSACP